MILFVGDPLIHLAEELLDGLFYVYAAFRQRQALEVAAQEATNDLQRLKNEIHSSSISNVKVNKKELIWVETE